MSKKSSLDHVHTLAEQKEEESAKKLSDINEAKQQQQNYLNNLQEYRSSYSQVAEDRAAKGIPAGLFRQYQRFLTCLDNGIVQQGQAIDAISKQLAVQRDEWQKAYQYRRAVSSLIDKQKQQLEFEKQKQEQKLMDEFNTRQNANPLKVTIFK